MQAEAVKRYPWKCNDCLEAEARQLGSTPRSSPRQVRPDGTIRTTVWKKPSGGRRSGVERMAGRIKRLEASGVDLSTVTFKATASPFKLFDLDRRGHGRMTGRILKEDEEAIVPCGRRHRGQLGSITVSNARFLQQVKRLAAD